jgi:hypothetical protein
VAGLSAGALCCLSLVSVALQHTTTPGHVLSRHNGACKEWRFEDRGAAPPPPPLPHAPPFLLPQGTMMRIEPKTFFANERTFLSWLHMAVTLGSIAAALLGFSTDGGQVRGGNKRPLHTTVVTGPTVSRPVTGLCLCHSVIQSDRVMCCQCVGTGRMRSADSVRCCCCCCCCRV